MGDYNSAVQSEPPDGGFRGTPIWLLLLVIVGVVLAVVVLVSQSAGGDGVLTLVRPVRCQPVGEIAAPGEGQRLVVVTELEGGRRGPSNTIFREVALSLGRYDGFRVVAACGTPLDADDARTVAARLEASMLLWGSVGGESTTVNVELMEQPDVLRREADVSVPLALPDSYQLSLSATVNREVPLLAGLVTEHAAALTFSRVGVEVAYEDALQNLPAASNAAEQARIDRNTALIQFARGNARLMLAGDAEGAIEAYDFATRLDGEFADAYYNRGVARYLLGQPSAQDEFRQALALDATNAQAHNGLGASFMGQGDIVAGLTEFEQAIALDSELAAAYNNRGRLQFELGDPHAAIVDYSEAIRHKSQFPAAYKNRAEAYIAIEDYQAAVDNYRAALAINPHYGEAHLGRGQAYFGLGRYYLAVDDFHEALRTDPENLDIYLQRGLAYYMSGDHVLAISDFTTVLQARPEDEEALLGRANAHLGHRNFAAAEQDLNAVLQLDSENAEAYFNRGFVRQFHVQDFNAAMEDYNRALSLGYDRGQLYLNRAELLHHSQNNPLRALDDYLLALESDPTLQIAYSGYSMALYELGRYDDSVAAWQEAIEFNAFEGVNHAGLSLALDALGQRGAAVNAYTQALALDSRVSQTNYLRREWDWPAEALLQVDGLVRAVLIAQVEDTTAGEGG